jgi:hypothetical protein
MGQLMAQHNSADYHNAARKIGDEYAIFNSRAVEDLVQQVVGMARTTVTPQ